jgi:hypothetical protein
MNLDIHVHLHGDDEEKQTLRVILHALSLLKTQGAKMANDLTGLTAAVANLEAAAAVNKQTLADVLAALKAITPSPDNQAEIDALTARVQAAVDGEAADDAAAEAAVAPPAPPAP